MDRGVLSMSDYLTPFHKKVMEAAEEAKERREKEVVACDECGTELLKDSIEEALDTAESHDEQRHGGEPTTTVNGMVPPQFSEEEKEQIQKAVQKLADNDESRTDSGGGE